MSIIRTNSKYKGGVEALRNLRIVYMHKELGYSFARITEALGGSPSRQQCASIYKAWKNVPFQWVDEMTGAIIH